MSLACTRCPIVFAEQKVDEIIMRSLALKAGPSNMTRWTEMIVERLKNPTKGKFPSDWWASMWSMRTPIKV